AGTTVIDSDESAEPDPSNPGKYLLKIARDDLPAAASKMYMIAERDNPAATSLDANWSTNLTILHGQRVGVPGATSTNLYCVEETDSIGIDEISLTIKADGVTLVDDVYIGDFDDGVYRTLEDFVHAIRFVDEVKVVLRDEDGGANGGDDFLRATIGGLPAGKTELLGQSAVLACCDGRYLFRYNLSGSLQKAN
ncbi:MAG: hypothetical protein KC466_09165, partial [Myxococcales bacterium]|nr:hypothetical protein [Myxococcales bacterium]